MSAIHNITNIASHEWLRLFKSPLAWLYLAVLQCLLGVFFFTLLHQFMQPAAAKAGLGLTETVVVGVLQTGGLLLLMASPIICMRLFSDELRSGAIDLLLSSPVPISQIVLGKYIATVAFFYLIILVAAGMLATLNVGTQLDKGLFLAALAGLLLLSMLFVAIGMFTSSLTAQPAVAAIAALITNLALWTMHIAAASADGLMAEALNYLSAAKHFNQFLRGLITSAELAYFILLIALFISLTIWRLDARLAFE